jgi:lipopolysaccharide export system protein LptA
MATFVDNVRLVQGDTTLECKKLVVYYDEEMTPASGAPRPTTVATAPGGSGGKQQIRKLEAKGGVVVTQKDQTATGNNGLFDMKTNSVTLTGNVVVTQGQNVIRGERLWVDLNTGVSRVESASGSPTRVQGLFLPNSVHRDEKPAATHSAGARTAPATTGSTSAAPARTQSAGTDKDKNKQGTTRPLKLN